MQVFAIIISSIFHGGGKGGRHRGIRLCIRTQTGGRLRQDSSPDTESEVSL